MKNIRERAPYGIDDSSENEPLGVFTQDIASEDIENGKRELSRRGDKTDLYQEAENIALLIAKKIIKKVLLTLDF